MNNKNVVFIGCGNMGGSIIAGLVADDYPPEHIWAASPEQEQLTFLQEKYAINITTDNLQAIANADILVLAVKPQAIKTVIMELQKDMLERKPLIITIAAGITTDNITKWLGQQIAMVRAMPNTPAMLRCGASGLFANSLVTAEQCQAAESLMRAVGVIEWFEKEKDLDTVTALSGSGPAYFFLLMEAMEAAAVDLGLAKDKAHLLTLQTALGAAKMALEREDAIEKLRRQVTSPGGTTESALRMLEQHQFKDIIGKALHAAAKRADELSKQ